MIAQTRPAVVTGVDGSESSRFAVDLAADEAARRDLPLRLVCGLLWPVYTPSAPAPDDDAHAGDVLGDAHRMLDLEAARVRQLHPGLRVATQITPGGPAGVLRDESEHAAMVVVGHRGRGGFAGLLAGSVATQVSAHARCPVIVVRHGTGQAAGGPVGARPVVVGVDGSELSGLSIGFAFEEAALRETPLTAVHVWRERPRSGDDQFRPVAYRYDEAHRAAASELAEALAGFEDKYPGVQVSRALMHGWGTAQLLLGLTAEAGLMVVGSRGRGGFAGLRLGSVSQTLVQHAQCPVAVIHRTGGKDRGPAVDTLP